MGAAKKLPVIENPLDGRLKAKDVAKMFRLPLPTVIRWAMEGKFPALHPGRYWYIRPEDFRDFLLSSEFKAPPPAPEPELPPRKRDLRRRRKSADKRLKEIGVRPKNGKGKKAT